MRFVRRDYSLTSSREKAVDFSTAFTTGRTVKPGCIRKTEAGSALDGAAAAGSHGQHGQPDRRKAGGSDRPGAGRRQVDDPTPDVRAAIVDADDHGAAGLGVGDLDYGAERQGTMSRSQCRSVGVFAVRGWLSTVNRCNSGLCC